MSFLKRIKKSKRPCLSYCFEYGNHYLRYSRPVYNDGDYLRINYFIKIDKDADSYEFQSAYPVLFKELGLKIQSNLADWLAMASVQIGLRTPGKRGYSLSTRKILNQGSFRVTPRSKKKAVYIYINEQLWAYKPGSYLVPRETFDSFIKEITNDHTERQTGHIQRQLIRKGHLDLSHITIKGFPEKSSLNCQNNEFDILYDLILQHPHAGGSLTLAYIYDKTDEINGYFNFNDKTLFI